MNKTLYQLDIGGPARVLLCINDDAEDYNSSHKEIAEKTGMPLRSVEEAIKYLVKHGILKVLEKGKPGHKAKYEIISPSTGTSISPSKGIPIDGIPPSTVRSMSPSTGIDMSPSTVSLPIKTKKNQQYIVTSLESNLEHNEVSSSNTNKYTKEEKDMTLQIKTLLLENLGIKTFEKNWHLKNIQAVRVMLNDYSEDEIISLLMFGLNSPFWRDKMTNLHMLKNSSLQAQWKSAKPVQKNKHYFM